MRQFFRYRVLALSLLALLLSILAYGISYAACGGGNLSDFCSNNFGLSGNLGAVGSAPSANFPAVANSQLPTAGADLDYSSCS